MRTRPFPAEEAEESGPGHCCFQADSLGLSTLLHLACSKMMASHLVSLVQLIMGIRLVRPCCEEHSGLLPLPVPGSVSVVLLSEGHDGG